MSKFAVLALAGGLLLSVAGCMQTNQPLTPYQQEYYKKQQAYQELGDNRRQRDRPCPPKMCK